MSIPMGLQAQTTDESLYSDALKLAKAHDSYVLITFTSNNCVYCDKLKNTYNTPEVNKVLRSIVRVEINKDKYGSKLMSRFRERYRTHNFYRKWQFGAVPVYFVVDAKEYKCIGEGIGYQSPPKFLQWLRNIKW